MIKEWKKINEEIIKTGYRTIARRTFQMPDNRIVDFDIKKECITACVVAITSKQEIVIAKQFRPGPEKIILELPGGGVDSSETPMEAIKREMLEETGYTGDFEYVGPSLDSAYSTLLRHNFVARNCKKIQEQKLEENEFIEVVLMPLEDFRKHLRSGELTDIETGYLGLDFLGLL